MFLNIEHALDFLRRYEIGIWERDTATQAEINMDYLTDKLLESMYYDYLVVVGDACIYTRYEDGIIKVLVGHSNDTFEIKSIMDLILFEEHYNLYWKVLADY